jgi:beta-phosphoglucomutase-like phosphatase (HAD superfamily)
MIATPTTHSLQPRASAARRLAAVIFDFDGTLVDTMPLHYEAYRRTFAEMGLELTHDDFYSNIGGNGRETIPLMLRGRDCPKSVAEVHGRKREIVCELFQIGPIKTLETAKLLPLLHGLLPLALASTGSRVGIEIILDRLGWSDCFTVVVTGEDAPRGKPAPDLFLLAAKKLGVEPADCLVFEDTAAGVAAAEAAGMHYFDVRATLAPSPAAQIP